MKDLLPGYAAGTLTPADRARVGAHLGSCSDCRADLAGWALIATAANEAPDGRSVAPPPAAELVRSVLLRSAVAGPPEPAKRWGRPVLALLRGEARLLGTSILVASALVMAFGTAVAAARAGSSGTWAADVLALVAPIVAAAGIAEVYGPKRDPAFEVIAATPTSLRLILLVRVVLVFGYDLALALAASVVLVAVGAGGPAGLIVTWLGPMALLAALSLALAVRAGPDVAIGAVVALWSLRVLAGSVFVDAAAPLTVVRTLWSTNPATMLLTAALVAAAIFLAGRGEPVRRSRATHLS